MRILKHGKNFKQKKTHCDMCECSFEYDKADISFDSYNQVDEVVKCPDCGYEVVVNKWLLETSF